jgi:hypothetical protein
LTRGSVLTGLHERCRRRGLALLIAEFVFAPFNLWTGRTMANLTRFTGLPPRVATQVLAPIKLTTAGLLVAGLFLPGVSVAGAILALAICGFYLIRLVHPSRRDAAGLIGFSIFAALAVALIALRALS